MGKKEKTLQEQLLSCVENKTNKGKTKRKTINPVQHVALFGLVGWSMMVPVFLGILLGKFLNQFVDYNITAITITFGMFIGFLNTVREVKKEFKKTFFKK